MPRAIRSQYHFETCDLTGGDIELVLISWIKGKRLRTPIAPISIVNPVHQRGPGVVRIQLVDPAHVCARIGDPLLFGAVESGQIS